MNNVTIKARLISQIESIQDVEFLYELEEIIAALSDDKSGVITLPTEIKDSITKSEIDILNNQVTSNENALQHLKEWIRKK